MTCKICNNEYHTTDEHEIFKEYFKKSKEDLVSIIISLEVENDNLLTTQCQQFHKDL